MANKIVDMTQLHAQAVARIESEAIPDPWSLESIRRLIETDYAVGRVCVDESGQVLGYYSYYAIADEADVNNIAVAPACRRQGIGASLMRDLCRTAQARGLRSAILEVRVSNAPAIALYRKFGFEQVGIRKKYYDNTEDALLLRRQ